MAGRYFSRHLGFRHLARPRAAQAASVRPSPPIKLRCRSVSFQLRTLQPQIINLGNAFAVIGEREKNNAMLENAASAYRAALEAQPAELVRSLPRKAK
jgi:hypothetical protein